MTTLNGRWELCSLNGMEEGRSTVEDVPVLMDSVQDIEIGEDKLVRIASPSATTKVEVRANGDEGPGGVRCWYNQQSERTWMRLEYKSAAGTVVDERRLFQNGSRLEQKLLVRPFSKEGPLIVERRYFRRRQNLLKRLVLLIEQQKVRVLGYLLMSQLILLWAVPSRLWGSFICAFHAIALCLIFFWSPNNSKDDHNESSGASNFAGLSSPVNYDSKVKTFHSLPNPRKLGLDSSSGRTNGKRSPASTTCILSKSSSIAISQASLEKQEPKLLVQDVFVRVSRARTRSRGLTNYSEFELLVKTNPHSKNATSQEWTVWHKYSKILEFHKLLEDILETNDSRQSLFTRIVPAIPKRTLSNKLFSAVRPSRAHDDLIRRRHAGLDSFIVRIFGPQSSSATRLKALADVRVQRFLNINSNDLEK